MFLFNIVFFLCLCFFNQNLRNFLFSVWYNQNFIHISLLDLYITNIFTRVETTPYINYTYIHWFIESISCLIVFLEYVKLFLIFNLKKKRKKINKTNYHDDVFSLILLQFFLLFFYFCFLVLAHRFSRVSVMRGQVITPQGLGIIGIRVSVDRDSRFGFTLTRQGGWWVHHFILIIVKNE